MAGPAMYYDSRRGLIHITKVTETIDRPIEAVWSVISAFGSIKTWMPGIDQCYVLEDGPQPPAYGAKRAVANLGMVMEETLEIWDLKEHYISYRLKDSSLWDMKGVRGSVRLDRLGDNKTQIEWSTDAESITPEVIAEVIPELIPFFKSGIAEARRILERPQQAYK